MIETIWNSWLLVALVPPFLYAVVALIDACLVDRQIYVGPREATVVSALFGSLPLLFLLPFDVALEMPTASVAAVAVGSGVVFACHIYFYIDGLFITNDTVVAETIQNLSVLLVPVLAFVLLDEQVSEAHYVAIGLAALGVILYAGNRTARSASLAGAPRFFLSMLCFSLILIAGQWVYERTTFWTGYGLFTLGLLVSGLILYMFGEKRNLLGVMRTHWRLFVVIEGMTMLGMACSHRAVDISPSVTFVAITECLGAYFILLISGLVYWINRLSGFTLGVLVRVCARQLIGYPGKIIAGLLISSGVYVANSF